MKSRALEQITDEIVRRDREEFAPNSELSAEEMEDDRLAHLLITAWTMVLKEDQEGA